MDKAENDFQQRIYTLVAQIPRGKVMSYGQIAALCGSPQAARIVGGIAHTGDPDLPWQRVVHKDGKLAVGFPGGVEGHKQVLEQEGIKVSKDYTVDIDKLIWFPSSSQQTTNYPLLVIIGETASGKSALALDLAEKFNGEIICADSRTIYKDMDIGTAKPTKGDQKQAKHHLIDVVEPDQHFTVAVFKQLAIKAIDDISNRGKLPIMVGGSGLYVDSVIYDYQFSPASAERDEINPRHLKKTNLPKSVPQLRDNTLIIGLRVPREELKVRISKRVDKMIKDGLIEEVKKLGEKYGWDVVAMQSTGYRAFRSYIDGELSLDEAKARFVQNDLDLAKRQRTWFKRNKSIHWMDNYNNIFTLVKEFLNN